MLARPMSKADEQDVKRLHDKMGLDYRMPDLGSSLFVIKRAVRDSRGVLGAAGLKLQAETYLWLDPELPVALRYKVVLALSRSVFEAAWRVGLDCLVAWLPPGLPQSFNRLLKRTGWSPDREGWQSWSKPIG